jgi:hypothetical protein
MLRLSGIRRQPYPRAQCAQEPLNGLALRHRIAYHSIKHQERAGHAPTSPTEARETPTVVTAYLASAASTQAGCGDEDRKKENQSVKLQRTDRRSHGKTIWDIARRISVAAAADCCCERVSLRPKEQTGGAGANPRRDGQAGADSCRRTQGAVGCPALIRSSVTSKT